MGRLGSWRAKLEIAARGDMHVWKVNRWFHALYIVGYGVSYYDLSIDLLTWPPTTEEIQAMSTPVVVPELPESVVAVSSTRIGEVLKLIGSIGMIEVHDDGSCISARELLKMASATKKQVEEDRKLAAKPFNDIADQVYAAAKTVTEPLDTAIHLLKTKLAAYVNQVNEKRAEAEANARKAATLIENDGRLAPAIVVPAETQGPAPVATRTTKHAEVTDFGMIPAKYKMIDMALLEADLKAGIFVPGARLTERTSVVAR